VCVRSFSINLFLFASVSTHTKRLSDWASGKVSKRVSTAAFVCEWAPYAINELVNCQLVLCTLSPLRLLTSGQFCSISSLHLFALLSSRLLTAEAKGGGSATVSLISYCCPFNCTSLLLISPPTVNTTWPKVYLYLNYGPGSKYTYSHLHCDCVFCLSSADNCCTHSQ